MAASSRLDDQQYKNWIVGTLALQYWKEGLETFIDDHAAKFHSKLMKDVGSGLPMCSASCTNKHIKKDFRKELWTIACPTCNRWLQTIIKYHTKAPFPLLSTDNTNPKLWPTDSWEVVKIFMSFGCKNTKQAKDVDAQATLSLFKNCTYFRNQIASSRHSLVEELLTIRNTLLHSGSFSVEDTDVQNFLQKMMDFLTETAVLTSAQDQLKKDAYQQIAKLLTIKLDLSENKELEIKMLHQHQKDVENELKALKARTEIIENEKDDQDCVNSTVQKELKENKQRTDEVSNIRSITALLFNCFCAIAHKPKRNTNKIEEWMGILEEDANKRVVQIKTSLDRFQDFLKQNNLVHDLTRFSTSLDEQKQRLDTLDTSLMEYDARLCTLEKKTLKEDVHVACSAQSREDQCKDLRAVLMKHYKATCLVVPNPAEISDVGLEHVYVDTAIKVLRESKGRDGLKIMKDNASSFSYRKLFYTDKYQCRQIYITGEAGSGKSMMCKNIVRLWCEAHGLCLPNEPEDCESGSDEEENSDESGSDEEENRQTRNRSLFSFRKLRRQTSTKKQRQEERKVRRDENIEILSQFTLLFYITLRDSLSEYSVSEMIESQIMKYHAFVKGLSVSDVLSNESCLIIVDGLDEWVCPTSAPVPHFMNSGIPGRDIFNTNNVVLTTSRPWKLDILQLRDSEVDKHVELCKLSKKSSSQICSKVIKLLNKSHSCSKQKQQFFQALVQKGLGHFKTIPVLLIQLICLWFDNQELGKSQVQLYCAMLDLLLKKSQKNLCVQTIITPTSVASETPLPTNTQTSVASETPLPTNTPTRVASETPLSTNTPTSVASETPLPTNTPTRVASETPLPTNTPTRVASETPLPTNTPTRVASETPLPTNTQTRVASETPLPTNTPTRVASETPLSTNTPTSVASETPLPTNTPASVASETPLPTNTPTSVTSETPLPTNTPTRVASETSLPTNTPTSVASETPLPTNTPTSVASETPLPTNTPTRVASETPLPTNTPTSVASETPLPTNTPTSVASETPLPTNTPTRVASETPLPTNTPTRVASETPLPTNTQTSVASETPLPTNTPASVASETPLPTSTPTSVASETPLPTNTPTSVASETPLPTNTPTSVASETPLPESITRHPQCQIHRQLIYSLSRVAYEALFDKTKENSLVFKSSQLEIYGVGQESIDMCLKSGILSQNKVLEKCSVSEKKMSFLHKKFQEFLAAIFLASCDNVQGHVKHITDFCSTLDTCLEMSQVWLFVSGIRPDITRQLLEHLTRVVSADTKVKHYRQTLPTNWLSPAPLFIRDIQTCVADCVIECDNNGHSYDGFMLEDFYIDSNTACHVERLLSCTPRSKVKSVYINTIDIGESQLTSITGQLEDCKSVQKLHLDDWPSSRIDISTVTQIVNNNLDTLTCLHLTSDITGTDELVSDICSISSECLMALRLNYVSLTHEHIEQILTRLPHSPTIRQLYLRLVCTDHDRQCIPRIDLSTMTHIHTLGLYHMSVDNLQSVSDSVEHVRLVYVILPVTTLCEFARRLVQTRRHVQVYLDWVTVSEVRESRVDVETFLRTCHGLEVTRCQYTDSDNTWWIDFTTSSQ